MMKGFLKKMDRDVLNHTLSFLDAASIVSVCLVCKKFKFMLCMEEEELGFAERKIKRGRKVTIYTLRKKVPLDYIAVSKNVRGVSILAECVKNDYPSLFDFWSGLARKKKDIVHVLLKEVGMMQSEERSQWWMEKVHSTSIANGLLSQYMSRRSMLGYFKGIVKSDKVDRYKSISECCSSCDENDDEFEDYDCTYWLKSLKYGSLSITSFICNRADKSHLKNYLLDTDTIEMVDRSPESFKWYLDMLEIHRILPDTPSKIKHFCEICFFITEASANILVEHPLFEEVFSGTKVILDTIRTILDEEDEEIDDGIVINIKVAKILTARCEDLFIPLRLHLSYFVHSPESLHPLALNHLKYADHKEILNIIRTMPLKNISNLLRVCKFEEKIGIKPIFKSIKSMYGFEDAVQVLFDKDHEKMIKHQDLIYEFSSLEGLRNLLGTDIIPDKIICEMIRKKKEEKALYKSKAKTKRGNFRREIESDSESETTSESEDD